MQDTALPSPELKPYIISRGRTVKRGVVLCPAFDGPAGRVAAVMDDRAFLPGETLLLPETEARHLISTGFVHALDEEPIINTAGPMLLNEFSEPPA